MKNWLKRLVLESKAWAEVVYCLGYIVWCLAPSGVLTLLLLYFIWKAHRLEKELEAIKRHRGD